MVIEQDTIAAIATALGEASIGVIRVSGPESAAVAERVFRLPSGKKCRLPAARSVHFGHIVHPHDGTLVDECILVWMPGPRSYTAEDVVELQVHGGVRVVSAVLEHVLMAGARLAEPGEFTKRAFLNGRIDLSQAEAVMDLIRSKTELARRAALTQVKGRFSEEIRSLRRELIALQAHVEVTIDYPEHDVEAVACAAVIDVGSRLMERIAALAASARVGDMLREGIPTVIVGRPNVGKSSLLNALLRRERAIVTDIPGTTRDVLEEYVNLRGIPYRLIDTAGIRETSDVVEKIGVERSREKVQEAQLAVVVLNGSEPLEPTDIELLRETEAIGRVIVINKMDLPQALDRGILQQVNRTESPVVEVSASQAAGLAALEEAMEAQAVGDRGGIAESSYFTNARQSALLRQAQQDLQLAIDAAKQNATLDIIAVQLQGAYASLGLVIGEAVGEDLLDEIFSRFCLGK
ncbi:tRNA uridine-5-carboxymethylaminomethyl(34) synthesis GTPase MnmE [Alicyclobacillus cycloheptanicus]|uniref:tRNA modification GTPase MnmE n=1 Tax=Alicyclobacillus cycloheptanicus TaxID=1457 RepID=A0ABT9XKW2_9BACL|nr:tRNA uridine-5-carboxymethylaminomethyl(34) synthesis GTPase MnmE [Alicyclobacillus cycloheptanicus]MDQ0190947.1 tRNA modification GTPase [Alicyclobacillus cycloheptanicus]WDM02395.1 tRNA uridine-5-carboxymethylaminomethyl(34) synthesis GTPase MnmE [Alicyclobacillus cycloheptanicus]